MQARPGGFVTGHDVGKAAKARGLTINEYLAKEHGVPFGVFEHVFEFGPADPAAAGDAAANPVPLHRVRYPNGVVVTVAGRGDGLASSATARLGVTASLYSVPSISST